MEETKHFRFFQNRQCEYFPCHKGVPEEDFNCLFCYCPLYALGKRCGGDCLYTAQGNKSCERCAFPHRKENYDRILARYGDIMNLIRKNDKDAGYSVIPARQNTKGGTEND